MRITQAEYDEILKRKAMKLANHVLIKSGTLTQEQLDSTVGCLAALKNNFSLISSMDGVKCFVRSQPSTDESKLNKTECAYLGYLRTQAHPFIGIQNIALKLADDTRYHPDFWIVTGDGKLQCHEVKGFWRDDAKVKIKVAARQFPFIEFIVVMKVAKGHGWSFESVKP